MLIAIYHLLSSELEAVITAVTDFAHHLSDCVVQGFATSHAAQIEPGEGRLLFGVQE